MTEKKMFQEYNEIIDKMLWKFNRELWDDLRSEAYVKFTYVRDNYNPLEGKFFSFAYSTVEMQMLNYLRKETGSLMRKYTHTTLDNVYSNGSYDVVVRVILTSINWLMIMIVILSPAFCLEML